MNQIFSNPMKPYVACETSYYALKVFMQLFSIIAKSRWSYWVIRFLMKEFILNRGKPINESLFFLKGGNSLQIKFIKSS